MCWWGDDIKAETDKHTIQTQTAITWGEIKEIFDNRSIDRVMQIIEPSPQLHTNPQTSPGAHKSVLTCLWESLCAKRLFVSTLTSAFDRRRLAAANTLWRRINSTNSPTWGCDHQQDSTTNGHSRVSALQSFIFSHLFFTAAAASRLSPSCLPPSPHATAHARKIHYISKLRDLKTLTTFARNYNEI